MHPPRSSYLVRGLGALLILGAASRALPATDASPVWRWINPLPQGNSLNCVRYADAMHGMAIGNHGSVIRSEDGGATWKVVPFPSTADLLSLDFADPKIGIITGGRGEVFRTVDGGAHWTTVSVPFWLPMNAFAFGSNCVGVSAAAGGTLVRTGDCGITWTTVDLNTEAWFYDVAFPDGKAAVVVGWDGIIMRSEDGGFTWKSVGPGPAEGQPRFMSLAFATPEIGIAGTAGREFWRTEDGGKTWRHAGEKTGFEWRKLAFADSNEGVAIGSDGGIELTHDGGLTWQVEAVPITNGLHGAAYNRTTLTVVGSAGRILRKAGPSSDWETLHMVSSEPRPYFYDFLFPNGKNGFVIGEAFKIAKTTDGGSTWTFPLQDGQFGALTAIAFADSLRGVVGTNSGEILRTTDGGSSWQLLPRTSSGRFIENISFADEGRGIFVGRGVIERTVDAGSTWNPIADSVRFNEGGKDAAVLGSNTFLVLTDTAIFRSVDAGATWSLAYTDSDEKFRTRGIHVTAEGLAFCACGYNGTGLLRSTDSGRTWSGTSGYTVEKNWSGLAFFNRLEGYAAGWEGAVAVTRDGGATWDMANTTPSFRISAIAVAGGRTLVAADGENLFLSDPIPEVPISIVPRPVFKNLGERLYQKGYDALGRLRRSMSIP